MQVLDSDYYIVRARRNKWDLAALHPQFADVITADGEPQDTMVKYRLQPIAQGFETDLIVVLTGAAMRNRVGSFHARDGDDMFGDERAGQR